MGYHRAGLEVVGVDIADQPSYPFTFIRGDATAPPVDLDEFDLVHASPPCQRFSTATPAANVEKWPDLIAPIRELLAGRPYVIENVPGAPVRRDLVLCGSMFGLEVRRHRVFELEGFAAMSPPCNHLEWAAGFPVDVTGNARGPNAAAGYRARNGELVKYVDLDHGRRSLGIEWVTRTAELVEAIPPAYTQLIGEWFTAARVGSRV
jgi:DNA (cytosine-5)-methyltransferase 1